MKGHPRFKEGDKVQFCLNGKVKTGTVYIVDAYGTFDDPDDASYDILVEEENMLYKHFTEAIVRRYEAD